MFTRRVHMRLRWIILMVALAILILAPGRPSLAEEPIGGVRIESAAAKTIVPSIAWFGVTATSYGTFDQEIAKVWPWSPAERSGLAPGDRIVCIQKLRPVWGGFAVDVMEPPFYVEDIATRCRPGDVVLVIAKRNRGSRLHPRWETLMRIVVLSSR